MSGLHIQANIFCRPLFTCRTVIVYCLCSAILDRGWGVDNTTYCGAEVLWQAQVTSSNSASRGSRVCNRVCNSIIYELTGTQTHTAGRAVRTSVVGRICPYDQEVAYNKYVLDSNEVSWHCNCFRVSMLEGNGSWFAHFAHNCLLKEMRTWCNLAWWVLSITIWHVLYLYNFMRPLNLYL